MQLCSDCLALGCAAVRRAPLIHCRMLRRVRPDCIESWGSLGESAPGGLLSEHGRLHQLFRRILPRRGRFAGPTAWPREHKVHKAARRSMPTTSSQRWQMFCFHAPHATANPKENPRCFAQAEPGCAPATSSANSAAASNRVRSCDMDFWGKRDAMSSRRPRVGGFGAASGFCRRSGPGSFSLHLHKPISKLSLNLFPHPVFASCRFSQLTGL